MARLTEAKFLKARREYRGLTQAELGYAAETADVVIGLFEAGERGMSVKQGSDWRSLLDARARDRVISGPSKG